MCEMFITETRISTLKSEYRVCQIRHSQQPIHFARQKVIIRAAADQEGGVASCQGEGDPLEQVPGGLCLLQALLSGQCCSQHLDLPGGHFVETPQGFHSEGDKGKTLLPAAFSCALNFPLVGFFSGPLPRASSCSCQVGGGQRAGDSDVYSRILAIHPSGDEDVCWARLGAREEVATLARRGQGSTSSCLEEDITDEVVAGNPFSVFGAAQSMIAHPVIGCTTSWTDTISTIKGDAKTVFEGGSELWTPKVKT